MENTTTVLVTGGTGFLGMRLLLQLLQKGYWVRTTVRNPQNPANIKEVLSRHGIVSFERLSFFNAELTKDENWESAMSGCKYVLSVASPVFFDKPKNEDDAIRPATEGILRILKFARKTGVKRVVMTSNFGAVGFTQTDKSRATIESDWTDTRHKGLSVYERSKTLAEKKAWDFIASEAPELEFVTINPVAILGPSLDQHVSGSLHLLEQLLDGTMKAVPKIPLNIVDVRDVADLHIRAMETPEANGQRFIATADGEISLPEIAVLLKAKRPEVTQRVSLKTLPSAIIRFAALFNHKAREGVLFLNMNRTVSNQKARELLNWSPVSSQENAILEAVDSLIQYHLIKNQTS